MADRLPSKDSKPSDAAPPPLPSKLPAPTSAKPTPPPGTYVVKVPKDQIYRVPPPGNARRYQDLSKRKPHRSGCRHCCCWFCVIVLFLVLALGIAAAVIYLVIRPESPDYTVDRLSIKEFNLSAPALLPEFDVTVRVRNPNKKIGIYYVIGSSVKIDYQDATLCDGSIPVFYQPPKNVTVVAAILKGSGIKLTSAATTALLDGERKGTVPFLLRLRAPVKLKVGNLKLWEMTVKVKCEITVNKLTAAAKLVPEDCDYGAQIW